MFSRPIWHDVVIPELSGCLHPFALAAQRAQPAPAPSF